MVVTLAKEHAMVVEQLTLATILALHVIRITWLLALLCNVAFFAAILASASAATLLALVRTIPLAMTLLIAVVALDCGLRMSANERVDSLETNALYTFSNSRFSSVHFFVVCPSSVQR